MTHSFTIRARFKSIRFALTGLSILFRTQHNAWVHLVATIAVTSLACVLNVTPGEWALLTIVIAQVWIAEGLNTAIEFLADAVTLERHPLIGKAKDVAAGSVLISAVGAAIVGGTVFLPYLARSPR
jgi:diacylglycerol kinase (ATP)